jgi:hypothetical protein
MSRISRAVSIAVLATAGSGLVTYYGYQYWKNIQIYPPETRTLLRAAIKATYGDRIGEAERDFHNALNSCIQITGEASVRNLSLITMTK